MPILMVSCVDSEKINESLLGSVLSFFVVGIETKIWIFGTDHPSTFCRGTRNKKTRNTTGNVSFLDKRVKQIKKSYSYYRKKKTNRLI
jgi:hypothetical protein